MKEETLFCTFWKTPFGMCYRTVARQSHDDDDDDDDDFVWILQTLTFHTEGRQRRRYATFNTKVRKD